MSGGSSRGKGTRGGLRVLPLCGKGLWVRKTLMNQCIIFLWRPREISPKSVHSEDMITEKKIGQNVSIVRTA
jgi:hypothetical protein